MSFTSVVTSVLGVISTLSIAFGLTALFVNYVLPILQLAPIVIELLIYSLSGVLMWSDHFIEWAAFTRLFITLLGCMAFAPATLFTFSQHFPKTSNSARVIQFVGASCSIIWGYQAIRLQSQLLGTFSVGALFVCLGSVVNILPFCYILGFKDNTVMIRTMSVAFYLIDVYVYATFRGLEKFFLPFRPGVLLGGVVYFIGCLTISSKYYSWQHDTCRYFKCNIIAIGSGLTALALGSALPSLKYLQGVGGTFFMLFIIVKWIDIPWGKKWAWGVTGFGVVLYCLTQWVHQYPEYLLSRPN